MTLLPPPDLVLGTYLSRTLLMPSSWLGALGNLLWTGSYYAGFIALLLGFMDLIQTIGLV